MKIKHRKSIGHYILDEVMGVNDVQRDQKERELKILEKSRPAEATECSECGKIINLQNWQQNERIECPDCGIELEFVDNTLIILQLGPSEE